MVRLIQTQVRISQTAVWTVQTQVRIVRTEVRASQTAVWLIQTQV